MNLFSTILISQLKLQNLTLLQNNSRFAAPSLGWRGYKWGAVIVPHSYSTKLCCPNDEIAKSEGRGQHREKLARHFPCCYTCFSRISLPSCLVFWMIFSPYSPNPTEP